MEKWFERYPFLKEILKREDQQVVDLRGGGDETLPQEIHRYMLERGWQVQDGDREGLERVLNGEEDISTHVVYRKEWVAKPDGVTEGVVDRALLLFKPDKRMHDGVWEELEEWTKIHFVLTDGRVIRDAVRPEYELTLAGRGVTDESGGETVLDAIERLGIDPDSIAYIVREDFKDYWRRSAPDYEREGYHDVYVYSLPGDVKLSSLVADAREYAVTDVCGAIFEELNGAAVAAGRHRNRV